MCTPIFKKKTVSIKPTPLIKSSDALKLFGIKIWVIKNITTFNAKSIAKVN